MQLAYSLFWLDSLPSLLHLQTRSLGPPIVLIVEITEESAIPLFCVDLEEVDGGCELGVGRVVKDRKEVAGRFGRVQVEQNVIDYLRQQTEKGRAGLGAYLDRYRLNLSL